MTPTRPDRRFDGIVFSGASVDRLPLIKRRIAALCEHGVGIAVIGSSATCELSSQFAGVPVAPGFVVLSARDDPACIVIDGSGPLARERPIETSDALQWTLDQFWGRGIGPRNVLIVDDGDAAPLLTDQLARHTARELPCILPEPGWGFERAKFDVNRLRANGALFALADGKFGSSGAPLASHVEGKRWVLVGGTYVQDGPETHLLTAPVALHLPYEMESQPDLARVLDLHAGVLFERVGTTGGPVTSVRFSSLARPGIVALRAHCPTPCPLEPPLLAPEDDPALDTGTEGTVSWMRIAGDPGGVVAAATDERDPSGHAVERLTAYRSDSMRVPEATEAVEHLAAARQVGFDGLLSEHRVAWARRWADADIVIEGDDELQRAIRYALFHLMASVPDEGEAAVGARGLTGTGYRGHVFWDADTFTLPFLAATHPASARAMLEYRIRRLPAAIAAAKTLGRQGARFPWESAHSGLDVTPTSARDRTGSIVPIRTGQLEDHIVAQVAWAACFYADWTGDDEFMRGPGRDLVVATARYWASRVREDADGYHIYGVIGPDEYHEPVDDNAFTNVIARWNLRRAAELVHAAGADRKDAAEAGQWRTIANALVDGYDPDSGVYEQFAGFMKLEPLLIAEVAPRRPIAADLLLGSRRVNGAQVLKQADVLMLHHLVPDEVEPGSLEPNLRFYEPRTAHGSSLSPGVHASLFARARDYERALDSLGIASRIDLDDLTDTTASGLHLATMGSLWQAIAFGFAGLRPRAGRLAIDPRLPDAWGALEVTVRFKGNRLWVRIEHGLLSVRADQPTPVTVHDTPYVVEPRGLEFRRRGHDLEVNA